MNIIDSDVGGYPDFCYRSTLLSAPDLQEQKGDAGVMGNAIELEHTSLSINGKQILKDISFSVLQGSFAGILGANGAGKTTLLKCINGIYPCIHQLELSALEKSQTLQNFRIHALGQDGKLLYDLWRQRAQLSVSADCRNPEMAQSYGIPVLDDSQATRELLDVKEKGKISAVLDLDGKTNRILEVPHFSPNTPQGGEVWQKFIESI